MVHAKPPEGMAQTGLFRRGNRYYFRLRVPPDLVSHYGRREFKFSLGSTDRAECIRKVRIELARLEREFEDLRQQHARNFRLNELRQRRITHLDDVTMDAITTTWLQQNLAADDSLRSGGGIAELKKDIEDTVAALRPAFALGETRIVEPAMEQFLALLGIDLAVSEDERRRLALKFLEASLQAATIRAQRLEGQVITTASVVPETTPTLVPPGIDRDATLSDVLDRWKKVVARRPRTLQEMTSLVESFEEYSQGKSLTSLTRQDGAGFRDHLKEVRGLLCMKNPHRRRNARSTVSRSISPTVVPIPRTALATKALGSFGFER